MSQFVVAAIYKFVKLEDCAAIRPALQTRCNELGITGSLLLATEGINGTIAGTRDGIDQLLAYLRLDPRLHDLEHKQPPLRLLLLLQSLGSQVLFRIALGFRPGLLQAAGENTLEKIDAFHRLAGFECVPEARAQAHGNQA